MQKKWPKRWYLYGIVACVQGFGFVMRAYVRRRRERKPVGMLTADDDEMEQGALLYGEEIPSKVD